MYLFVFSFFYNLAHVFLRIFSDVMRMKREGESKAPSPGVVAEKWGLLTGSRLCFFDFLCSVLVILASWFTLRTSTNGRNLQWAAPTLLRPLNRLP